MQGFVYPKRPCRISGKSCNKSWWNNRPEQLHTVMLNRVCTPFLCLDFPKVYCTGLFPSALNSSACWSEAFRLKLCFGILVQERRRSKGQHGRSAAAEEELLPQAGSVPVPSLYLARTPLLPSTPVTTCLQEEMQVQFYSSLFSIIVLVRLHWVCVPELIAMLLGEKSQTKSTATCTTAFINQEEEKQHWSATFESGTGGQGAECQCHWAKKY